MISLVTLQTSRAWIVAAPSVYRRIKLLCLSVILLGMTSCSFQTGPKLPPKKPCIKVTGHVLVDGEPAEGVQIILHPTDDTNGLYQFPIGTTDADGEFKLRTYGGQEGAPKGNYAAVFIWPIPIDDQVDDDDHLKRLYRDPRQSTFKVTIDDTTSVLGPFDLKLKGLEGIPLTKSEIKELRQQQNKQKVTSSN